MTPADRARIRLLGPEKCPPDVQDEYHAAVLAEIASRRRAHPTPEAPDGRL